MRVVQVLYFAALREAVGYAGEELTVPGEVRTVGEFGAWLERARPALSGRLASVRFAVNETFATAEEPIAAGDTVALIPPVSGG